MPHDHFGRLLVILLALFVVSGFHGTGRLRLVDAALMLLALAVAARATGLSGPRWTTLAVAVGLVGIVAVVLAPLGSDVTRGISYIGIAIATVGTLVAVLARIVDHDDVNIQTLAGALCAYLLIGFLFTEVYGALDALGSSAVFGGAVRRSDYSYFSFVTLTTLGYGDLAPVTDGARRVAVLEAMLGQVFLATTVARLVSMFAPRSRTPG